MAADLLTERLSPVQPTAEFSSGGTLTDLDGPAGGTCTVTLTRPDGTAGPGSGTVTHVSTGKYSFVLAGQPEVTVFDVAWSGAIGSQSVTKKTQVEVVGDLLFTLAAAKAWDAGAIPNAGVSDADILAKRISLLDDLERPQRCNVAFVPRYTRETHHGTGGDLRLWSARATKLLSVTVNGVAQDLAGFTLGQDGILRATSNYAYGTTPIRSGISNVVVEYVRGHDQVPGPVSEAALRIARATLVPSNIGDRATSITNDAGTILLATAGRGSYQPYGIPLADSVLAAYHQPLAA
ncbi:MAG TPA: hypothetical protein VK942_10090 [Actinomycetes bacterium]|nr:hypothetical protein [Actinomycetes bacterium]